MTYPKSQSGKRKWWFFSFLQFLVLWEVSSSPIDSFRQQKSILVTMGESWQGNHSQGSWLTHHELAMATKCPQWKFVQEMSLWWKTTFLRYKQSHIIRRSANLLYLFVIMGDWWKVNHSPPPMFEIPESPYSSNMTVPCTTHRQQL